MKKEKINDAGKNARRDEIAVQIWGLRRRLTAFAQSMRIPSQEIEDLISWVIIKAMERPESFDGKNLPAWSMTVLKHRFLDTRRRAVCRDRIEKEFDHSFPMSEETDPFWSLQCKNIIGLIPQLPEERQELVVLAALGYSESEINEKVKAGAGGTVRSRLFRARRYLENFN